MNKKAIMILVALLATLALGFIGGYKWKDYSYLDSCLDAGGSINTTGQKICVLQQ